MERIITTQTQFVRHEASEQQRKVAEANARAYMAAHLRTHEPKSKKEAQDVIALKKKLPRYIAVETPKDQRSVPGTKKDVMIWDTQSESLVGNNVYDVANVPAVGATAKFDTYSAQYVGNGL